MADEMGTVTVAIDGALYRRLKEIADLRRCTVEELVDESVKNRYFLHTAKERRDAVDSLESMALPVGSWEEIETEIIDGAWRP